MANLCGWNTTVEHVTSDRIPCNAVACVTPLTENGNMYTNHNGICWFLRPHTCADSEDEVALLCVDGLVSCVEWRSFSFVSCNFLLQRGALKKGFQFQTVQHQVCSGAWVYHFSLREACENKYDFVLRFFASHLHPSKKPLRKPRDYVMFCVI